MDLGIIKSIIIDKQRDILSYRISEREVNFDDDASWVLVGLRRAGKSYLLYRDIQERVARGDMTAEDFLYMNFEDERLPAFTGSDIGEILTAYNELYPGKKPRIYLDEIQNIQGWEQFARRLADSGYRVMITGSNAQMLSREIASRLGGRYISREIFPFQFREYIKCFGNTIDKNWEYDSKFLSSASSLFDTYFSDGGISESFVMTHKREYLNSLYQKILLGDIIERHKIRNARVFRLLAKKLADSVMQPVSLSRLRNIIKSSGDDISLPVLKDYLEYLEEAYLFFSIPNLDSPVGEKETIKKRYIADNGLLNLFSTSSEAKLLENIVAVDLNRRFRNTEEQTLLYYYNRNIEIDFCIPSVNSAIQVSCSLNDPMTYERETGALVKFIKAHPEYSGTIVTRNEERLIQTDGIEIKCVPVWKWLLR